MNIRLKKLLALLLALIMTVGLFPTASFAEEAGTSGAAKLEKVFTEEDNAILDQDVFDSYDEALAYLGAEKISGGTFQKGFQFIFGDFTIRLYNMDNDISLSNENTNSFVTLITKGNKKALFRKSIFSFSLSASVFGAASCLCFDFPIVKYLPVVSSFIELSTFASGCFKG